MAGGNSSGRKLLPKFLKKTDGIAIELGVWKGGTTKIIAEYFSEVHAVDAWKCEAYYNTTEWESFDRFIERYSKWNNLPVWSESELNKVYDETYDFVVERFRDIPHIHIHRMTTDKFFETFDTPVDFIYVDASHSEADVYRDLNNSWNILKDGGMMIGDDYETEHKEGVTLAWKKFVEENNLNYSSENYQIMVKK